MGETVDQGRAGRGEVANKAGRRVEVTNKLWPRSCGAPRPKAPAASKRPAGWIGRFDAELGIEREEIWAA